MKKSKVKYWFDVFTDLESFDVIPYQDVIELYNKTEKKIRTEVRSEENDGTNSTPFNSDVDKIDHDGFWFGYPPKTYMLRSDDDSETVSKSDVVSMDMVGLNKTWDSFMYLEIPSIFFDKYQKSVCSNSNVEIYREFLKEIDTTDLKPEAIDKISNEFDMRYPDKIPIVNFFRTYDEFAWRIDLDVKQYISMKRNGIIYPICYNSTEGMLHRGTHRMLFLSSLGSSVPVFLQYPKTPKIPWEVKLGEYFGKGDTTMIIDIQNKKLEFFINNKLIETYE
jgi:hypothetical protein